MKSTFQLFLLLFFFAACESTETENSEGIVSENSIDTQFQKCYYEDDLAKNHADSVLISLFGTGVFVRNIRIDLKESTMNCQVDNIIELVPFGDRTHCAPNSYDLSYTIYDSGETIFSFRMIAGSDMLFETASTIVEDQLLGYRELLSGNFKVDYARAKAIALANGVDLGEAALELVKAENGSYHWEAELEYDHNSVVLLLIDVISGKTSKEVLTMSSVE